MLLIADSTERVHAWRSAYPDDSVAIVERDAGLIGSGDVVCAHLSDVRASFGVDTKVDLAPHAKLQALRTDLQALASRDSAPAIVIYSGDHLTAGTISGIKQRISHFYLPGYSAEKVYVVPTAIGRDVLPGDLRRVIDLFLDSIARGNSTPPDILFNGARGEEALWVLRLLGEASDVAVGAEGRYRKDGIAAPNTPAAWLSPFGLPGAAFGQEKLLRKWIPEFYRPAVRQFVSALLADHRVRAEPLAELRQALAWPIPPPGPLLLPESRLAVLGHGPFAYALAQLLGAVQIDRTKDDTDWHRVRGNTRAQTIVIVMPFSATVRSVVLWHQQAWQSLNFAEARIQIICLNPALAETARGVDVFARKGECGNSFRDWGEYVGFADVRRGLRALVEQWAALKILPRSTWDREKEAADVLPLIRAALRTQDRGQLFDSLESAGAIDWHALLGHTRANAVEAWVRTVTTAVTPIDWTAAQALFANNV